MSKSQKRTKGDIFTVFFYLEPYFCTVLFVKKNASVFYKNVHMCEKKRDQ